MMSERQPGGRSGGRALWVEGTAFPRALEQKEGGSWRPSKCGQVDVGEVKGPYSPEALVSHLDFITPVMENPWGIISKGVA